MGERSSTDERSSTSDLIQVRSARLDDRVAIFEQNEDHPGGEVFIAGNDTRVFAVAPTPAIMTAIADSRLVLVNTTTSDVGQGATTEGERKRRVTSDRMVRSDENR